MSSSKNVGVRKCCGSVDQKVLMIVIRLSYDSGFLSVCIRYMDIISSVSDSKMPPSTMLEMSNDP